RRGGDRFDYPVHEANIAEALNHQISTGALTYEQFVRKNDLLSIFVSGQKVERDSYYGANKSLSDYGKTNDFTYTLGVQYNARFAASGLVVGIENNASELKDQKLGFADFDQAVIVNDSLVSIPHTDNVMVANQRTQTTGVFAQYEYNLERFKLSAGARFDHYTVTDFEGGDHTGNVLSPRLSAKIDIFKSLQGRLSYSQGYRSPQIYDEDLHIETSGSRKVIHVNSPDLEQESSRSFTASLDFNKQFNTLGFGFLAEAFYTQLDNPFANLYSLPDENGTVIYTRINAKDGANVQGLNFELNLIPTKNISIKAGFTVQKSRYDIEQDFKEKRFFRTPQDYGFLTFDWELNKQWGISSTANYTGAMLVPYFGPQIPNPEAGVLITSGRFLDMGLKIKYGIKLNGATLQLFAGVKNLFNSYQNDFDNGINRDPGFIYGPVNPRTIYFGLKVGNFLN
ncbi:MAG: TonB-dependent receptor, partial [Bacteroidales bacterium]|nr:TonB-dependent receptor [Bacteroidales bacterium]